MRIFTAGSIGAVLVLAAAGTAGEDAVKALLDKAIAARGGEQALRSLTAATWKSRAKFGERASHATLHGQLPGQFRLESESIVDGKSKVFIKVIDGERGWSQRDGHTVVMKPEEVAQVKRTFHQKQLDATLLPLRDPGMKLTLIGESKVGDRTVIGMKIAQKDHADMKMYFDKETMMVLKSEMMTTDPRTGVEAPHTFLYSDYHDFDGIKMARKTTILRGGKKIGETEILEFKRLPKVDAKTFQAP